MSEIKVESITTKFGTAKIGHNGYWVITSRKEGNGNKLLHRLLYEDFYGVTLLKGNVIHHKDENKLNNRISNLELITKGEHNSLHNTGRKHSEEVIQMLRDVNLNKKHPEELKLKISKHFNTSGYFRVSKVQCSSCSQGFRWMYRYIENGKTICLYSVNLDKLEEKVKSKGLTWIKFEEEAINV